MTQLFHQLFPGSGKGKRHPYIQERLDPKLRVLDYGCGGGGTVEWLRHCGYRVQGYDPSHPQWQDTSVLDQDYDVVLTQDVLEHIPLEEMPWRTLAMGTQQIHIIDLTPAKKHLPDGTNAHCTLLPADEWRRQLEHHTGQQTIDWRVHTEPDPNFGERHRLCVHLQ